MTVEVAATDILKAFIVWKNHRRGTDGDFWWAQAERRKFSRYVNDVLPVYFGGAGTWEMTEGGAHRIKLLLGPHAATVIKTYEIRNARPD